MMAPKGASGLALQILPSSEPGCLLSHSLCPGKTVGTEHRVWSEPCLPLRMNLSPGVLAVCMLPQSRCHPG